MAFHRAAPNRSGDPADPAYGEVEQEGGESDENAGLDPLEQPEAVRGLVELPVVGAGSGAEIGPAAAAIPSLAARRAHDPGVGRQHLPVGVANTAGEDPVAPGLLQRFGPLDREGEGA